VIVSPATQAPAAQQPDGHEVPSQTQVLATQRWPSAHAPAALPHRHVPVAEQLSERASQATQVEPALPHADSDRVEQVVPAQQPLGHDVASQVQSPLTQRWPPLHAAPVPQPHVPAVVHLSDLAASHTVHAAPLAPQVARPGTLQTPPLQHPFGHDVASQMQVPPWQRWPLWQAGPPAQWQVPSTAQVSARLGSHAVQTAAPIPHAVIDLG